MIYRWRRGWDFERLDSGDVRVSNEIGLAFTVPAEEWVSIVVRMGHPNLLLDERRELARNLHITGWKAASKG